MKPSGDLLGKDEFREIIRRACIKPKCEGFAACYGDDRFLGIFADGTDAFEFYVGREKIAEQSRLEKVNAHL